jgi:hypothetical protein
MLSSQEDSSIKGFAYICESCDQLKQFTDDYLKNIEIKKEYNFIFYKSSNNLLLIIDELQLVALDITNLICEYAKDIIDIQYISNIAKHMDCINFVYNNIKYSHLTDIRKAKIIRNYALFHDSYTYSYIKFKDFDYNSYNLFGFFNYYNWVFNKKYCVIPCESIAEYDYNSNMTGVDKLNNAQLNVKITNYEVFDIMLNITKILILNIDSVGYNKCVKRQQNINQP